MMEMKLITILAVSVLLVGCRFDSQAKAPVSYQQQQQEDHIVPIVNEDNDSASVKEVEETQTSTVSDISVSIVEQSTSSKPKRKVTKPVNEENAVPGKVAPAAKESMEEESTETEMELEEESVEAEEIVKVGIPSFSHKSFDKLLSKHVTNTGKVDYRGLLADKKALDSYLKLLSANPPNKNWSQKKQLAYWINAYNAFTLKMIIDNYPVGSIMDLHNGKPWDVKWIKIGKETYSLNNIENDIIRPKYKEPRIHFAVNCAAKSCPPLSNEAYTNRNLEKLLERNTKAFINNKKYNTLEEDMVNLSKIFEWYGVDFDGVLNYVQKYSTTQVADDAKIGFKEYDWSLNE